MSKKILIIDGNSLINRAFYGVPLLTNSKGKYTNAIYGFLNMMLRFVNEERPDHLVVAFDLKEKTFRHKHFEDYKGNRSKMPEELAEQFPKLKEILVDMGIEIFSLRGFEADDIIGTIADCSEKKGIKPVIISGDRDLLQLATDKTKIRIPKTSNGSSKVVDYYRKDVIEKYEVTPEEFIDLKALMGDSSDNIPGVPGIGIKTATKIIKQFGSLKNAIENIEDIKSKRGKRNLKENIKQAEMSKYLATIIKDVPVECKFKDFDLTNVINDKVYNHFKELEFRNLIQKYGSKKVLKNNKKEFDFKLIKDIKNIKFSDEVSYKIFKTGIAFSQNDNDGFYVKFNDKVNLKSFKYFFEDENITKIGYHIKDDLHKLESINIEINGKIFDIMLMAYILEPGASNYSYDHLATKYLDEMYKSKKDILGKGKSQKEVCELEKTEEYTCLQTNINLRLKNIFIEKLENNDQINLYNEIELPLIYVLKDMEKEGFKINLELLDELKEEVDSKLIKITEDIHEFSGEEFNVNSPKQLGEILFEKLELPVVKKTKTGYSTSKKVLKKLQNKHPIISLILEYRKLSKLKGTYIDGLKSVINKEDGKIHSTFNQMITATGRISSTNPNLQNIPVRTEIGRNIRKLFIPSSNEYKLVDADYSQIELRVLAHISKDENLIDAFNSGEDIHSKTASQIFSVEEKDVTKKQRRDAKVVNFGIVYGMGAYTLSKDLKITRKEAEKYIENYFKTYSGVKDYMDKNIEYARKNGYVKTMFNRKRKIDEINSKNYFRRSFAERAAMNTPIQGTAADIMKIAMINVYNRLEKETKKSKIVLQVHDELIVNAHVEELDKVEKILKEEMKNAVKLDVPIIIDQKTGDSWYETK